MNRLIKLSLVILLAYLPIDGAIANNKSNIFIKNNDIVIDGESVKNLDGMLSKTKGIKLENFQFCIERSVPEEYRNEFVSEITRQKLQEEEYTSEMNVKFREICK